MYGVPSDLNVSAFYGERLDQLCLGPFDLQFHFTNGKYLSIEGSWRLVDASGTLIDESDGRVGDQPGNVSRQNWRLRSLLSDTVESGEVDAPRSFTLRFASGRRLTIFDDSKEYESFSIQPGDIFV